MSVSSIRIILGSFYLPIPIQEFFNLNLMFAVCRKCDSKYLQCYMPVSKRLKFLPDPTPFCYHMPSIPGRLTHTNGRG